MIEWLLFIVAIVIGLFALVVIVGAPYVPSQRRYCERALAWDDVGERDVLLDLGSGDGIVLRIAARRKARAVGYEINPVLVIISRILGMGHSGVEVKLANMWTKPFPDDVTIVYAFSSLKDGKMLLKTMQREATRLGRPLRLLCYGSPLPGRKPSGVFEAYHSYTFQPLQRPKA